MRHAVFALTLCASPALAEGYENHGGVQLFSEPCANALEQIDWINTVDADGYVLTYGVHGMARAAAASAMAWGFVLGYDARAGGLHTSEQTTLERLREGCAANPDMSAKAILDALSAE